MSASVRDIIVFIGPPGSGKGTISGLCVKELGWVQISTGNLCRKHIADNTKIGQEIDFAIKSGKLVSDNLITDMIIDWFKHVGDQVGTVVLDGYPRTVAQAQAFNQFLVTHFDSVRLKIVRFHLSDETIIARLSNRYVCQNKNCQAVYSLMAGTMLQPKQIDRCDNCDGLVGRRKDDEYEAIVERLKVYNRHEQELLGFYNKAGHHVYSFHVDQPVQEVFEEFKRGLGLQI